MAHKLVKHSPKALKFYREQLSLSVDFLAHKAKIKSVKKVGDGEHQNEIFTFKQIQNLAEVLLIPEFLLLTDSLQEPNLPPHIEHRNHIEATDENMQYRLNKAIYELLNNRENLLYTYESLEIEPKQFNLQLTGENAVVDSETIRKWLDIENCTLKIENNDDYYRSWRTMIEKKDVLVIELSAVKVGSEGMALHYDTLPIIGILSSGQTHSRRLFTMIHELVHLGLNQSSIDGHILQSDEMIERYCNQVAGHVLLPQVIAEKIYDSRKMLDENIANIRKKIKVSKQAIAIQLKLLGYINQIELNAYMQSLVREQLQDDDTQGGFGVKQRVKTANQFGKVYLQQVISAVWNDAINISTAMQILHLKDVQDLTTLEQKVFA